MTKDKIYEIDYLCDQSPYFQEVKAIIDFFNSIGSDSRFDVIRIIFSINTFCHVIKLLKNDFTINDYRKILTDNILLAKNIANSQNVFLDMLIKNSESEIANKNIEEQTQNHYSTMFSNFRDEDFFEIAPNNLKYLFQLNNFKFDTPETKIALDAGCGSGRYSYGLKLLGFKKVVGLDFSFQNIDFATKKIQSRNIENMEFIVGDVTNMPFDDESFDFVLSNGVLHHVNASYDVTLKEINRVLKPKGIAYLSVMENPGCILLNTIDIIRYVLKNVPESTTLTYMKCLGFRGYTIYNVLDHIYVPINKRVSQEEIENSIKNAGFVEIKRFERGLPNYNIELLRKNPHDPENIWKYGIGKHIYTFKKPF